MRRTESTSMKVAIGEFLERNKLRKKFDQTEVISLWKTLFGPVVANRTTQLFF